MSANRGRLAPLPATKSAPKLIPSSIYLIVVFVWGPRLVLDALEIRDGALVGKG